jgi:hypothetical protein
VFGENRERQAARDVVEMPGLTAKSEHLLTQLEAAPRAERGSLLEAMAVTPEGRQALEEAKAIANALVRRLGTSYPRQMAKQVERGGLEVAGRVERIAETARLVNRAHRLE